MHEGALGVHQVELAVEFAPGRGDGRGVGQHAHGTLHAGQVSARHHRRRLVVDAHLEPGGTPVHEPKVTKQTSLHYHVCYIVRRVADRNPNMGNHLLNL